MARDNEKSLVKNAADPDQVKKAGDKEKLGREQELADLAELLGTSAGKRFLWRMLSECGTFASIWTPNAQIHYNAGRQDIGHFLMKEIVEASPDALLDMMKANK